MIGKRIAHYEIVGKLGEGGMGVVYKSYDTHLDRFVAIKVLLPERLSDQSDRARFLQEAKAASTLNHPNIVVVYDAASEADTDFIVMEYIQGQTLDELIPSQGMPVAQALNIAVQICDALVRAHAAGIIHRDLKPTNVMIDEYGLVKILDFGLAKLAKSKIAETATTLTMKPRTIQGSIIGTASYMSPEQAEGKPVDERTDIFSFGEVLYEMISGQPAFRGDTDMSTLVSVISRSPRALKSTSPKLELIVNRCLTTDPSGRYQRMEEVRAALGELRGDSQSDARILAKLSGRGRHLLWFGSSAAILAVAAGLWLYSNAIHSGPSPSIQPVTTYRGDETFPSFSPDGSQVAFVWSGEHQDNPDIYVKTIGTDKAVRLTTDPRPDLSPAWSPDGRYIAFLRQLEPQKVGCFLISPEGGAEWKLGDVSGQTSIVFRGLAWLRDSRRLLVGVMASAS